MNPVTTTVIPTTIETLKLAIAGLSTSSACMEFASNINLSPISNALKLEAMQLVMARLGVITIAETEAKCRASKGNGIRKSVAIFLDKALLEAIKTLQDITKPETVLQSIYWTDVFIKSAQDETNKGYYDDPVCSCASWLSNIKWRAEAVARCFEAHTSEFSAETVKAFREYADSLKQKKTNSESSTEADTAETTESIEAERE